MGKESTILRCALYYADKLGWCIIPIPHKRKEARIKWRTYQKTRPDREQSVTWFGNGCTLNMAVVLGSVSGDLCCRDFDICEAYERWAAGHTDLEARLPTVKTARGYHVYFVSSIKGIRKFPDGELRGSGGYCLVPPSVHPDGPAYEWIVRPTVENLIAVDPELAGLLPNDAPVTEQTENTEKPEQTEHTEHTEAMEWGKCVERIICETLPREFGTRNRRVFDLARTLKSLPQFAGAEARDLRSVVQEWHRRALSKIRTKEFEESWIDFLKAWPRVRYPRGSEPMMEIFQRAVEGERPQIAVAKYPDNERLQILVALCRELQRATGGQPFYLSCRVAGRLLSVSHTEAGRWLFLLESDGILRVVAKGGTHENPRNATRFRYLGD